MTIYFVDIEAGEQHFFGEAFPEEDLIAVHQLSEVGADAEIVSIFIGEPVSEAFLHAHPKLRLIATRSSSVDHIDVQACARHGVLVCHVPHYSDETVAEHTFALILALARRLREVMSRPRGEHFSYEATRGFELRGRTLGIIGMGKIGQRVTTLARSFEMEVIAHDIENAADLSQQLGFTWKPLDELLTTADIISLHAPLSAATYHIINADTLARTKRGVLIINTARGALVDTAALRAALDSGHVGGAGLDVLQDERLLRRRAENIITEEILHHLRSDERAMESRDADRLRQLEELVLGNALLDRSNVIFTPHVAFNSVESMRRVAEFTAENIRGFLQDQPINLVMPHERFVPPDSEA